MKNQVIESLPTEVAEIAKNVSVEKSNEVRSVLNNIFNGVTKMKEQLEKIIVSDENDKINMKLANTIRLGVRQARLDAEKTFDAKRAEVQSLMLSYKTEDQLWLKAKQTMQILTKEIEESARWKEETAQRFEAEQKELKIQQRIVKVSKVAPEILRSEFENMSDESFDLFLSGVEKQYNDRIEAERKAKEEAERVQKELEKERERTRLENERLKAEALEKEKQIEKERARAEAERKAIEEKARKEKEATEKKAAEERAKQEAIIKAERKAKEKIEAELKAKKEAEERSKKEADMKEAEELRAKKEAERKAKAAPDKVKLKEFAKILDALKYPELKSEEAKKILDDTKKLISKVSVFINEKTLTI